MKYLLTLILIFSLGGCRTPQDMTPPPINNNKMTLELQSCENQEVGLLGCFYNESQSGSLTVPLWSNGEYQIKSERCGFFQNQRYEGSQTLDLTYAELLANKPSGETTCLYNIKVFIDKFDNGFEGFFLLSAGDIKVMQFEYKNNRYTGYGGLQVREGAVDQDSFKIHAKTPGIIFWEGCQKKGEIKYQANPEIPFKKIIDGTLIPAASCILTVGLIPDDVHQPVEIGKIHINIYDKTVVPLPQPVLIYRRGRLTVKSDRITAAIAIGNSISIEHGSGRKQYRRNVIKDKEVDVRIMTSNGRFMLIKVKNGEALWIK